MWKRLKAMWGRRQKVREEERLLRWKEAWRPSTWARLLDYGYEAVPHRAIKPHTAAIILPKFKRVYIHPLLTYRQRRLVTAMAIAALARLDGKGGLTKPYLMRVKDLAFPEGPEDNVQWTDWINALEYLAPMTYVDYLKQHYPEHAQAYLVRVFDLDPAAATHRLTEHRMWQERKHSTLFHPTPFEMD